MQHYIKQTLLFTLSSDGERDNLQQQPTIPLFALMKG